MKNFSPGQSWLPAEIVKITGPVSFRVRLTDGRTRRCHQDQLRVRERDEETNEEMPDGTPEDDEVIPTTNSEDPETTRSQPQEVEASTPTPTLTPTLTPEQSSPPTRYPRRNRKKRVHFEPRNI